MWMTKDRLGSWVEGEEERQLGGTICAETSPLLCV